MGQPVVHFEVMGTDAAKLQKYYAGIAGGIGGSPDLPKHVTFYVEVPDVDAALQRAESLGGSRVQGPDQVPGGPIIGLFHDPEENLVGVTQSGS